jgi:hypothetical protein
VWILKLWGDGQTGIYKNSGKTFRRAYLPYITKLTTLLIESPNTSDLLKDIAGWKEYQAIDYKQTIDNECFELGAAFKMFDPEYSKARLIAKESKRMNATLPGKDLNFTFKEYD